MSATSDDGADAQRAIDRGDPQLTVAEAAAELRLSPATIRSWISKGTIHATRSGQRKWLVRRSELERMRSGSPGAGSELRPKGQRGSRAPRRLFPDTITPPAQIDREEWLGVAQWEWLEALNQSEMAPPDAWFIGRLQRIAETAARKVEALRQFDDDEEMYWEHEPPEDDLVLSHELRPGGNRPGPAELWDVFDERVAGLARAMKVARAGTIAQALDRLSIALHDIADALVRYRGRYGNWQPEQVSDTGEQTDRAGPTTEESVS